MSGCDKPRLVRSSYSEKCQQFIELAGRFAVASDPDEIADLYQQLLQDLPRHLAEEEAPGGMFERVLEVAPDLAPEVEKLRGEHDALLRQLYEMTPHAPGSRAQRRLFLEGMYAHEFSEGQSLRDAFEGE